TADGDEGLVAAEEAGRHREPLGLTGPAVHVDVLQLTDPVAGLVHHVGTDPVEPGGLRALGVCHSGTPRSRGTVGAPRSVWNGALPADCERGALADRPIPTFATPGDTRPGAWSTGCGGPTAQGHLSGRAVGPGAGVRGR